MRKNIQETWNLQRHAKLCTGKIVCAVCSEEFQTKRLLERHGIKQHAVKLVYRCHVCGRNYRRPDKYQLHKKKCADRYESDSMFSDYDEDDSRGGDPLKLVTINLFSKKFDLYDYKQEKLCWQSGFCLFGIYAKETKSTIYCARWKFSEALHTLIKYFHTGARECLSTSQSLLSDWILCPTKILVHTGKYFDNSSVCSPVRKRMSFLPVSDFCQIEFAVFGCEGECPSTE